MDLVTGKYFRLSMEAFQDIPIHGIQIQLKTHSLRPNLDQETMF